MFFTSLSVVAIVLLRKTGDSARNVLEVPLAYSALIISFILVPSVLFGGWMTNLEIAVRLFWLSLIWLVISLVNGRRALFMAFQTAFTLSVMLSISALMGHQWPSTWMWLDPLTLQAQAIALAILSLMAIVTRIWLCRSLGSDNALGDLGSGKREVSDRSAAERRLFAPARFAEFLNPARLKSLPTIRITANE